MKPFEPLQPDKEHLDSLEQKLQLIRDRVKGVAFGFSNGLYLWGLGGISKSWTVEQTLREMQTPYKLSNSRITASGLFQLLSDLPDAIHVLEDVETLFKDKASHGLLRSALWGLTGRDGIQHRVISWIVNKAHEEFVFTGRIIMMANSPLDNVPALAALKTRINVLHFQPSNEEIAAKMRAIARDGYRNGDWELSPSHCLEVVSEIIECSIRLHCDLDLRMLPNCFLDRLQFERGKAETYWRDLVGSRLSERILSRDQNSGGVRAARKEQEQALAKQLLALSAEQRLKTWVTATGKSKAALYRRMTEVSNA